MVLITIIACVIGSASLLGGGGAAIWWRKRFNLPKRINRLANVTVDDLHNMDHNVDVLEYEEQKKKIDELRESFARVKQSNLERKASAGAGMGISDKTDSSRSSSDSSPHSLELGDDEASGALVDGKFHHLGNDGKTDSEALMELAVAERALVMGPLGDQLRKRTFTTAMYRMAKARFGFIEHPTTADRLAVRRYLSRKMRELKPHIRDAHICQILEIATNLVFVPSRDDIDAKLFLQSRRVRDSLAQYHLSSSDTWRQRIASWLRPSSRPLRFGAE